MDDDQAMSSQLDLDQGGTSRQWVLAELGPTFGGVWYPLQNLLITTAPATVTMDPSSSMVQVNVAGPVTVILPSAKLPPVPAQPGLFVKNPVTIADIGGNASAHPITIQAQPGENVMGLASIRITANYGAFTLEPSSNLMGWNSVSP
jgi:hypothetical protein